MNKIFGFIPARSGSKGVIHKNIRDLDGKPLISWSVDAALASNLDQVVVSSDAVEYLEIVRKHIHSVPNNLILDVRPQELADDNVQTVDVIVEFIERFLLEENDLICLLQPTTPFRDFSLINHAIQLFTSTDADAVVSVVDVDGMHPNRMKIISNGKLYNYSGSKDEDMRPRQELPKVYIRSGSIYLSSVASIIKHRSLVPPSNVVPIIEESAVNIDTEHDFLVAESIAALNRKL